VSFKEKWLKNEVSSQLWDPLQTIPLACSGGSCDFRRRWPAPSFGTKLPAGLRAAGGAGKADFGGLPRVSLKLRAWLGIRRRAAQLWLGDARRSPSTVSEREQGGEMPSLLPAVRGAGQREKSGFTGVFSDVCRKKRSQ